jgi:hypothetical protein
VHVTHDVQRALPGAGLWGGGLGFHGHLDSVAPVDDGKVALGRRVPLGVGLLGRRSYVAGVGAVDVRTGLMDVRGHPEVAQRRRPLHLGSLTGPLSHRPLHHRAALHRIGLPGRSGPRVSWAHHRNADRAM